MTETAEIKQQQSDFWNGEMGEAWVVSQELIDGMLKPFEHILIEEAQRVDASRIIDVGCGNGVVTRALADTAQDKSGPFLGIDLSGPMIANAQRISLIEKSPATFVQADAAEYVFEDAAFDFVTSRFGAMFFPAPEAAFRNLRRAVSSGGTLAMIVWGAPEKNAFMTLAPRTAAELLPPLPERDPYAPGPFSLANPTRVDEILSAAGWSSIETIPQRIRCTFPATQLDLFLEKLAPTGHDLTALSDDKRAKVMRAIRTAYQRFISGNDVQFDAHVCLIRAHAS